MGPPVLGRNVCRRRRAAISLRHLLPGAAGSSQGARSEFLGAQSPASPPQDAAAASISCSVLVPVSVSLLPTRPSSLRSAGRVVFSRAVPWSAGCSAVVHGAGGAHGHAADTVPALSVPFLSSCERIQCPVLGSPVQER